MTHLILIYISIPTHIIFSREKIFFACFCNWKLFQQWNAMLSVLSLTICEIKYILTIQNGISRKPRRQRFVRKASVLIISNCLYLVYLHTMLYARVLVARVLWKKVRFVILVHWKVTLELHQNAVSMTNMSLSSATIVTEIGMQQKQSDR